MGQRDLAQNEYFKDKLRFADVCNGILFQGREVIRPEELQEKEAYFGIDKKWDGARSLYDMLDMNEEVEPYISNYKMNLFDFHECRDFFVFKTENRLLFETLASCKTKKEMYAFMKAHEDEYEKWDVLTTKLMCDLMGLKHDKILKKMTEEGISMCRAVEELMEDAREEGREMERILSVRNLCKNLKMSVEQAMDALMIPINEREQIVGRL